MARNPYFSEGRVSEQNLYEDIIIESLKIYGRTTYYIPRDLVNVDKIFGDDVPSRFNSSYQIEMYVENVDGFDGEGDLFTKFGIEIRDQVTFVVSRRRWNQAVALVDNEIQTTRPMEGDLIYLPMSNKLWEITFVEHEAPFYQLNNLPTYKLRCELFEYSGERLDTNIPSVDQLVYQVGYNQVLFLLDSGSNNINIGDQITQSVPSTDSDFITGHVSNFNDSDHVVHVTHIGSTNGNFYQFAPGTVTIEDSVGGTIVKTVVSIDRKYNHPSAQNKSFDDVSDPLIDFSEQNPFGDPPN